MDDATRRLGGLFFLAHQQARAVANAALRPHEVELRHIAVLTRLSQGGAQSQKQIADAIGLDKSSMVRMVDELERQGLVERQRSTSDRRMQALNLTAAGRLRLLTVEGVATAAMDRLLAPLDAGERAELAGLLARVVEQ
jgi:DNA-binding MarR family transcriptional regulator